jgi:multidrug efflux pump subunit AcrA (membrane-fusion protein)
MQRRNLGLKTSEAEIREMGQTIEVPAVLVIPPEKHGKVTAPFAGRVVDVLVKLGQELRSGEPVLKVAPLAVGSPPQTLTAPVSGHVIRQNSVPGQTFSPETSLVEIGDDTELLAQGLFFQSPALTNIKLGGRASFLLDLFPGENFDGALQRLDTGHGPEDPSFHVYASIPNLDHRLRPNFRGRLAVEIGPRQPVVAVPRRAVLGSLGRWFVFVDNGTHFEEREIVTGLRGGDWIEIVEGVLPGEKVVTVGNYQLQYISPEGQGDSSDSSSGHGHGH